MAAVKARQNDFELEDDSTNKLAKRPEQTRRAKTLLSEKLKCEECGGNDNVINRYSFGCSVHRAKGIYSNGRYISLKELESRILLALQKELMQKECVQAFNIEYSKARTSSLKGAENDLDTLYKQERVLESKIETLLNALEDGQGVDKIKLRLSQREDELKNIVTQILLAIAPEPDLKLSVDTSAKYKKMVRELRQLQSDGKNTRANEQVRALIAEVHIIPPKDGSDKSGPLDLQVIGALGEMVRAARGDDDCESASDEDVQFTLVAGVGFEPTTFRL